MTQEKYTAAQLAEIIAEHGKWLSGKGGSRADLYRADLSGANLSRADLSGAKNLDPKTLTRRLIVPESGAFEGWKKLQGGTICRVRIPAEAARVGGAIGRKCRAEFVEVLEGEGVSIHDQQTKYAKGATATASRAPPARTGSPRKRRTGAGSGTPRPPKSATPPSTSAT